MTAHDANDDRITAACRKAGAKNVSDAAYSAMSGRTSALAAIGLGDLAGNLPALYRITTLAYKLMSDEDQVADYTEAVVAAAKWPPAPGAAPAAAG